MKLNGATQSLITTIYAIVSIPTLIPVYATNGNSYAMHMSYPTKLKTNLRFAILTRDYLSVKLYRKLYFFKHLFFAKKINRRKNL